jgi:Transposase C of IS166 homeodomain
MDFGALAEAASLICRAEKLRVQLARFRRAPFGPASEKIERTIEHLQLGIEALEEVDAQRIAAIPAVRGSNRERHQVHRQAGSARPTGTLTPRRERVYHSGGRKLLIRQEPF